MGSDICLSVARYSHATGLCADNTVSWTHIGTPNLFIIIRGTDKNYHDENLMLRIVQGNDVLESLDVGGYIDDAIRTRRNVQAADTLYMEQLPIFGITKDTIVALRYTMGSGQARRLQMRMHSSAECRQIVNALQIRGMEFKEQRPGTARPGTARPLTMSSQIAPAQGGSPYFKPPEAPARHPFTPQVLEAGSLSQIRSPDKFASGPNPPFQQAHSGSQEMPPPKLFTRDETFAPREVVPTRPSTAQVYRSHTNQPQRSQFDDTDDIVHQAHKSGFARPSSTSNTAGAEAISEEIEQHQPLPQSAVHEFSPHVVADPASSFHSAQSVGRVDSSTKDVSAFARPTTSSSFLFTDTLEHEIPPRRELPFARTDSRRSGSEAGSSRSRSALTLPPLPKPRLSPQNSISSADQDRPASKAISPTRPQTSSPLKRSIADTGRDGFGPERPSTASPAKRPAQKAMPSPSAPSKKPSRMEELLQGRKESLEKSSAKKATRTDSLADAPGEEDMVYASRDPSPSKLPDRRDSMSPIRRPTAGPDPTVNAYAAISSAARSDGGLRQYADQSLEDRQTALDEFMVQNIENPDFMVLCKDVENCWRRIALGL